MKFYNVEGLVIKKEEFGEADRIVTLLTPRYGRVQLFIKGIKKSKKRDRNATDILSLSKFIFYKKGDNYIVTNFELKESFLNIRSNMDSINISMYLLSILNFVSTENQRSYDLYSFSIKSIRYLNKLDNIEKKYLLICYFLNKIIDEEGISLVYQDLDYLDIERSKFSSESASFSFKLNRNEKDILSVLLIGNKDEKIQVNDFNSIVRVINILEKYINYHLHTNLNFKHFLGEGIKDAKHS